MKNKILAALFTAVLTIALNQKAFALDSNTSTITSIRITDWAVVLVMSGKNNGCGSSSIKLDQSLPHIQNLLSVALSAQMANKKVKAKYITCSNSPWPNTASAKDLTIYSD